MLDAYGRGRRSVIDELTAYIEKYGNETVVKKSLESDTHKSAMMAGILKGLNAVRQQLEKKKRNLLTDTK